MRYCWLLVFLLGLLADLSAQNCNCPEVFQQVIDKVKKNYIGFGDRITPLNKKEYQHLTDSLQQAARTADMRQCFKITAKWLDFFKDKHVSIRINEEPSNHAAIRSMFSNTERVAMTEQELLSWLQQNKNKLDSLEGIWEDENKTYRIGIIHQKNSHDFTGFILKADSLFWMPGQVKLKVSKKGSSYQLVSFAIRDHSLAGTGFRATKYNMDIKTHNGWLRWYKVYPEQQDRTSSPPVVSYNPSFKILDSNTCLLTIPYAGGGYTYKVMVDSLLALYDPVIKLSEHMIIDVRNNTGGTVTTFWGLLPLLYTNPIITPGTSVLATDDNINDYYAKWDYPDISDSLKRVFAKEADELRAHQGTIYELWKPDTFKLNTVLPYPKRVSILMDENCASSTELFLLKARQSSKVTLYGKHTMGAVDYTNASTADMSCKLFKLRYSTSRSNTALTQPIDNIGIRPDVMIQDDVKDWIQFVRNKKR